MPKVTILIEREGKSGDSVALRIDVTNEVACRRVARVHVGHVMRGENDVRKRGGEHDSEKS